MSSVVTYLGIEESTGLVHYIIRMGIARHHCLKQAPSQEGMQPLYNSLPRQHHCRRREIAATFLDVALVIGYRYMLGITCYLGNI